MRLKVEFDVNGHVHVYLLLRLNKSVANKRVRDLRKEMYLMNLYILDILGESNHHPPSSIKERWHLGAQLILFVSMLTSVGIGSLVFGTTVC